MRVKCILFSTLLVAVLACHSSSAMAADMRLCSTEFPGATAEEHPVACSVSLVTYSEARTLFGKRVADRYVVVQVRLRNLDGEHAFVLHDILLGYSGQATGGRVREVVNTTIQEGDIRDVIIRGLRSAGILTSAFTAYVPEAVVVAGGVLSGPVLDIFQREVPNVTLARMERLQSLGWSSSPVVISQQAASTALVFLPQAVFFDKAQRKAFKKSADALLPFQSELKVAIAGMHVQEVTR